MKRIALLLFLFCYIALLSAISFDDVLNTLYDNGKIDYHDGDVYWIPKGFSGDEAQANAWVAWAAAIILYVQADWELSIQVTRIGQLKAVKYVGAYWRDEYSGGSRLVYVPMSSIMSRFNNENCHEMEFNVLKARINEYVTESAPVRGMAW